MRIVSRKFEYLVQCKCNLKIAYTEDEYGQVNCPQCGNIIICDRSHQTYSLEKVNVYKSFGEKEPIDTLLLENKQLEVAAK